MNKKQKNKEKTNENEVFLTEKNFEKANIIYLCAINPSFKLKNVSLPYKNSNLFKEFNSSINY